MPVTESTPGERRPLMSDNENDQPKREFVPYDADEAIEILNAVFPRSTVELVQQSTGVPIRTVTRWLKGESRMPPNLVGKFRKQSELRDEFREELRALYDDMRADGLSRQVARSVLLELAYSDYFSEIDEI
ncbi:MAG: hypothetical protein VYD57_11335 [Pseudomonadota bacterium]|nr:hypothetical protein [Pseudomonadota bacterium]